MADKQSDVTIIPASRRPDGTWRKEIKVKAGYVPPDEVERYQSRGREAAANRSSLPPGISIESADSKKSKNQKKNERKKQKKQQEIDTKAASEVNKTQQLATAVKKLDIKEDISDELPKLSKDAITKKLKSLKKKLRQIEDLEKKVANGEIKELEKEQNDKVARKKEVLDEIEDLELDLKLCDE